MTSKPISASLDPMVAADPWILNATESSMTSDAWVTLKHHRATSDASVTLQDGNLTRCDRSVSLSDGSLTKCDASVTLSDGIPAWRDANVTLSDDILDRYDRGVTSPDESDATVTPLYENLTRRDDGVTFADGNLTWCDESVMLSGVNVVKLNFLCQKPCCCKKLECLSLIIFSGWTRNLPFELAL